MTPVIRFQHLMDAYLAGAAGYRTITKKETSDCREIVTEGLFTEHNTPTPHFLLTMRGAEALVASGAIFRHNAEAYFGLEADQEEG